MEFSHSRRRVFTPVPPPLPAVCGSQSVRACSLAAAANRHIVEHLDSLTAFLLLDLTSQQPPHPPVRVSMRLRLSQMRPLLSAAAESPLMAIRELLAQQLQQIAKKGEEGADFLWGLGLNRQLLCLLTDSETSVAIRAETALATSICFRVLSPLIHGVIQHESFFTALRSAAPEVLSKLQQLLEIREDPLLQSNASDLLCSLIGVSWGMEFVISEKIPELVARQLAEEHAAQEESLSSQTMLRLLCSMAVERPPECSRLMELEGGLLKDTIGKYLSSLSKRERVCHCQAVVLHQPYYDSFS
ncbi:hypothetical protein cyc_07798 [Cyclospora cayetanensis]|uniref:Uncharacterized protein n=1 Tax=Cyclospora cayetanensis TaxID=88456 RepID=A0A1D3D138_9EIME|nr:hypothetical protein cyc_07798 [Cyclospora cayetanensis]